MPAEPDPQSVAARRVLFDTLKALGPKRKAVILIGAQAIYLHTGSIELALQSIRPILISQFDPAVLEPIPENRPSAAPFAPSGRSAS
jgi:hypothetical protein